ncbi:MAG: type II toxin-antitoxin system VapC family toxin [Chloroflexota bacterium]|nr:type II toxin-antitoxin system VapC family toxin [Chloroflexota bacterium]
MKSIPPYVFVSFDSCAFFPPVKEEKLATEKLLTLIEERQIQFSIPEAVLEETSRAPDRVRKIAHAQIYDYDLFTTQDEQRELSEVKIMLFKTIDGISQGNVNDARNLLCAKKYGSTYFVTFDKKHILSKRVEIKSKLGFEVVTPRECLEKLLAYLD